MAAAVALYPSRRLTIDGACREVRRCLQRRIKVCLEIYSHGDKVVLYEYSPRAARANRAIVIGLTSEREPKRKRRAA